MKALSIHNPYANLILLGYKPLEIRSKKTNYRGDILICATKHKVSLWEVFNTSYVMQLSVTNDLYRASGYAIGIATLADCRPMTRLDEKLAFCEYKEGLFAYELTNVRAIKPFPVCGNQGFFNVEFNEL